VKTRGDISSRADISFSCRNTNIVFIESRRVIIELLKRSRVIADSWRVVIAVMCGELVVGENP